MTSRPIRALTCAASATLCLIASAGAATAHSKRVADFPPATGSFDAINLTPSGDAPNDFAIAVSTSDNGRYVAYYSYASDLVAFDTNDAADVFLRDTQNDTTTLISRSNAGVQGDDTSYEPQISANGKYVVYVSWASNFEGPVLSGGIYRYNVATGHTILVSKSHTGAVPNNWSAGANISASGRYVVYFSRAHNIVRGDHNHVGDIFVWDARTSTTTMVSKTQAGGPVDNWSYDPSVSDNGRYITYITKSKTMGPTDTNRKFDTYLYDKYTDTTTLVSRKPNGEAAGGEEQAISGNGRFVVFTSASNDITPTDHNPGSDIFVYSVKSGAITLTSKPNPALGDGRLSGSGKISANGRYVAYQSWVTDPTTGADIVTRNIYLYDRATKQTTKVTVGMGGEDANGASFPSDISADGSRLALVSDATNLTTVNDPEHHIDVYVWTRSP